MIDHIGLRTARFATSKQFFISSLAPLGIVPAVEYPGGIGFSRDGAPTFWLGDSALAPSSMLNRPGFDGGDFVQVNSVSGAVFCIR